MKIWIVTENYPDGSKHVCTTHHRGTGYHVQVHRSIEDAEWALRECIEGLLPKDKFWYEINELEI